MMREVILSGSNEKKDKVLIVRIADSFFSRLCGLMGTAELPQNRGLLLVNCNSIHMCFMRYAIDVVYTNKEGEICKVVEHLRPWRISACFKAKDTLEIADGAARGYGLVVGRKIEYEDAKK
jgi:hypothetical protein